MYRYLTLAALVVTFINLDANAAEAVKKDNPAANKMDTNHDGMVSLKEANAYGDKTASEHEENKDTNKTTAKETPNNGGLVEGPDDIEPLDSRAEFPWSNSKKR